MSRMQKTIINTDNAPLAIGPYSQAVKVGDTVYISGQIPLDPATSEMVSDEFSAQAVQVFKNLTAVAVAAGGSLNDAVKLMVYVTNLDNFSKLNDVMTDYCSEPYPARAAVEVSALPKVALVEVDAVLQLNCE